MKLVILWLIQDLLTVFTGGRMQIPGIFLMGIVYKIVQKKLLNDINEDETWAIWSGFAGGIFWDLRWVGVPGFFTIGYVGVILIVIQVLRALPPQTEDSLTWIIIFVMLELTQILPPLVPVIILGGTMGIRFFGIQQLYALPVIIICLLKIKGK